jgi:hypothetical protein
MGVEEEYWVAYTQLAAGCSMLTMSVIVFIRLWKGKRDQFAMTLTAFTFMLSLQNFEGFMVIYYQNTFTIDGEKKSMSNYYISQGGAYFYYLAAL